MSDLTIFESEKKRICYQDTFLRQINYNCLDGLLDLLCFSWSRGPTTTCFRRLSADTYLSDGLHTYEWHMYNIHRYQSNIFSREDFQQWDYSLNGTKKWFQMAHSSDSCLKQATILLMSAVGLCASFFILSVVVWLSFHQSAFAKNNPVPIDLCQIIVWLDWIHSSELPVHHS